MSILIYHRAMAGPDNILHDEVDAGMFLTHMTLLASEFNVLPVGEAADRLARGTLPARAACITFDDGYADNERIALPILKRLGLRATFFVSSGFSAGGAMFNDIVIETVRHAPAGTHDLSRLGLGCHQFDDNATRRAAVDAIIAGIKYRAPAERVALAERLPEALRSPMPTNLMMTEEQIRKLHGEGMEIGAHTVNHPILSSIGEEEARAEIVGSKRRLEEITGAPVTVFAYPNGRPGRDYRAEHVRLVKEAGFRAAVSTSTGIAHKGSDLFQLPRYGLWDRTAVRLGVRMLSGYLRPDA